MPLQKHVEKLWIQRKINTVLKHDNNDLSETSGVLVADKQGLCLAATGIAVKESSGVLTAILNEAAKLNPSEEVPSILMQSFDSRKAVVLVPGENCNTAFFKICPENSNPKDANNAEESEKVLTDDNVSSSNSKNLSKMAEQGNVKKRTEDKSTLTSLSHTGEKTVIESTKNTKRKLRYQEKSV